MNGLTNYIEIRDVPKIYRSTYTKFIVPQNEIIEYFSRVTLKEEILNGLLHFGSRCFSSLAVFSVCSNTVQYIRGIGGNVKNAPYGGPVNVDSNTIMRRVITNKFPYKGRIPVGSDEKSFFIKYFNKYAEEVFVYPACISGQEVEMVFYADSLEGDRESSLVTFEYIAEKAILAMKLLWVQKQLMTI